MAKPNDVQKLDVLIWEYRVLLGCVIQALESYDSDDGLNDLVLAGITAEVKRLEDQHVQLRPRKSGTSRGDRIRR